MEKILAFGDSILKGVVLREGKYTIAAQKFTQLAEQRTGITIDNKGRMGHTILQLDRSLRQSRRLLEDDSFDYVLLEYGGNDCDFNWEQVSIAPRSEHDCKVPREDFINEYLRLIEIIKSAGKSILLLSLPPIDGEKYFQWFSKTLDKDNILQWLHNDTAFLTHWHESYNLAVYQIGAAANIPVIDITTPFLAEKNFSDYLCEDGIHPNEQGQRMIADILIPLLEKEKR